jgi:hypothetical protein
MQLDVFGMIVERRAELGRGTGVVAGGEGQEGII